MARNSPLFTSSGPTALASAKVTIGHLQLRDLIVCPRKRGVVNYIRDRSIVEHDLRAPESTPRVIANASFAPNTIASLQIPDSDTILLAAGGQEADVHLSLHGPRPSQDDEEPNPGPLWQFETRVPGSINNSAVLTCMNMTKSPGNGFEPKIVISNNDCTVKFYDIPLRGELPPKSLKESGILLLDVAVNHSSLSPDGRTLLSVGDSPKVYLHRITGGRCTTFTPITTLTLTPQSYSPLNYSPSSPAASFSTAFSADGSKFVVASQEGSVVVWDVRSTKPLKIFNTDKSRPTFGRDVLMNGNGLASGWLIDDPWDWARGASKAPGWGVRSVKFGGGGDYGKEVMVFTEHTSLVHVIDAQTFDTEEIIRMPSALGKSRRRPAFPIGSRSPMHVSSTVFSSSSSSSSSPPPPAPVVQEHQPTPPPIILALQDTFRIPSEIPSPQVLTPTTRWRALRMRSGVGDAPSPAEEDLVVIPPLGDRVVESDVQRLLERHGIRSRRREAYADDDDTDSVGPGLVDEPSRTTGGGGGDVDMDELESDCASSHTPSRAASPVPPAHVSPVPTTSMPSFNSTLMLLPNSRPRRRTWTQSDFRQTRGGEGSASASGNANARHGVSIPEEVVDVVEPATDDSELDLAGICFDPSHRYLYVASVDEVAEWSLRGSEKRWWVGGGWA